MAYADIFKDDKTFPDTIEVTLPNGDKVTLGEVRELTRTEQKKLASEMETLTRERRETMETAAKAADLMAKLEARAAESPAQKQPDDFDDPWWNPVKSKLTPLEEAIKKLTDAQTAQQKMVEQAALIFANDRWKRQFSDKGERLKSPKYSDWTFEKVREYAAQNKILDEYGIPAVDKAIEAITKEDELEQIKKEAFERGLKEGSVKARIGQMPRPTSASGAAPRAAKGLDPAKNFEDLGDTVAGDSDLAEMLANLQGVSPEDLLQ